MEQIALPKATAHCPPAGNALLLLQIKMRNRNDCAFFDIGGPEGDRTLDLRVANAALSQLSYEPV